MKHAIVALTLSLLGALAGVWATAASAEESAEARSITWDDLVPEGWTPPEMQIDHFFDAAPPPAASLADTPVVQAMDQQRIRLPGYLVPLDVQENQLKSFLMVPYFGACIHVPPPPPNQVVYVEMSEPVTVEDPYGAHWVTGILSTSASTTNLAEASYTMSGESVEVFDWDVFYEQQQAGADGAN